MKRLSREALRMRLWVGLAVVKGPARHELALQCERRRDVVVNDLVNRIMGAPESEAVVLVPDVVGGPHATRHGKWDVDEPHPHPDVPITNN